MTWLPIIVSAVSEPTGLRTVREDESQSRVGFDTAEWRKALSFAAGAALWDFNRNPLLNKDLSEACPPR